VTTLEEVFIRVADLDDEAEEIQQEEEESDKGSPIVGIKNESAAYSSNSGGNVQILKEEFKAKKGKGSFFLLDILSDCSAFCRFLSSFVLSMSCS
jgi:hypothetical protein